MFEVLKSVITAGGFKLADIQYKIKKLYALGDLAEEQMDELLMMASGRVSTDAERPETIIMFKNLSERMDDLEARLDKLEGNTEEEPGANPEVTVYPKWEQWDGISNKYQPGAIVDHKDELWESIFKGQNVWEPGAPGTESMWIKYVQKVEET